MSNYTITEEENTLTLTPKPNTKYQKTTYNNTLYHNNNTNNTIQAKKGGTWNTFSLLTLTEITIPNHTHYDENTTAVFTFKDVKDLTIDIQIPLAFKDFEEEISEQFNPVFNNNMGYMYGFLKTVLFDIYTDETVLAKLTTYEPKKNEVTLTITAEDTETLENGLIVVTATGEDGEPISDLEVTGNVGDLAVSETTDTDGVVSVTLEEEGTYPVMFTSKATSEYKSATAEDTITATTKESGMISTPQELADYLEECMYGIVNEDDGYTVGFHSDETVTLSSSIFEGLDHGSGSPTYLGITIIRFTGNREDVISYDFYDDDGIIKVADGYLSEVFEFNDALEDKFLSWDIEAGSFTDATFALRLADGSYSEIPVGVIEHIPYPAVPSE